MNESWEKENREGEDNSLKKLNFSALKELIGKKKAESTSSLPQPEPPESIQDPNRHEDVPIEYPELSTQKEAKTPLTEHFCRRVLPSVRDESSVNIDAVITGTIESKSDVNIYGTVHGNVTTQADMIVNGTLIGDVCCRGLYMNGGRIQGTVTCTGEVFLENDAMILGNLSCAEVSSNGRIRGDIYANGFVSLRENAVCFGNISADHIGMTEGAVLKGQVEIRSIMTGEDAFSETEKDPFASPIEKTPDTFSF